MPLPPPAAAPSPPGEQDLGPLAWVVDELRQSLDASVRALRRFVRDAEAARDADLATLDVAGLRAARQHLHQAGGALEMVGMSPVAVMVRAMEAVVQKFAQRPELCSDDAAGALERASFAVSEYLDAVLAGKATRSAVGLFPQFRDLQSLAGSERAHPADLWPIERRHPRSIHPAYPDPARIVPMAYAATSRGQLDQAVLRIVKDGDPEAARSVAGLAAGFAAAAPEASAARRFWHVCAAFFEALAGACVPLDVYVKRVASRVLMQYTALSRSDADPAAAAVSERLLQDLLFYCSQARMPSDAVAARDLPSLVAVRRDYQLAERFEPVDYETWRFGRFDPAMLAQARKRIAGAAETWSALAGGDRQKLKAAADQFGLVGESLRRLHPDGARLAQSLAQAVEDSVRANAAPSTALAMEVATSILYLQAAYDEPSSLDQSMPERSELLAGRLDRARTAEVPEPLESWMEDLYRRVNDRQTMGSVVEELRQTLHEVETSLDRFFRDPQATGLLAEMPGRLAQMRGVLSVLGLEQASTAVLRMRDTVERLLAGDLREDAEARTRAFDKLGSSLGALGFLIDMLSYQPSLARKLFVYDEALGELRILMGRQRRRLNDSANSSAPEQRSALPPPAPVAALSDTVAPVVPAFRPAAAPADASAAAAVVPPAAPAEGPPAALPEFARADAARDLPPPAAAPRPAPPPAADDLDDDLDLREIFLEEAREVLSQGRDAVSALSDAPAAMATQTALRRAFHTLKGSGRMVGLSEFGEAAWALEQVLNTWLADQRPATEPLLRLCGQALTALENWTDDIAAGDADAWSAEPFRRAGESMRARHQAPDIPPIPEAEIPLANLAPPTAAPDAAAGPSAQSAPGDAAAEGGGDGAAEAAPSAFDWEQVLADEDGADFADTLPPDLDPAADREAEAPFAFEIPGDADEASPRAPGAAGPAPAPGLQDMAAAFAAFDAVLAQDASAPEAPAAAPARSGDLSPATAGGAPGDAAASPSDVPSAEELDFSAFAAALGEDPAAGAPEDRAPAPDAAGAEPGALPPVPQDVAGFPQDDVAGCPPEDAGRPDSAVPPVPDTMPDASADAGAAPPSSGDAAAAVERADGEAPAADGADAGPATAAPQPVPAPRSADDLAARTRTIGPLRISTPLYHVYLGEAQDWSQRLQASLDEWAQAAYKPLPEAPAALAHSLAGSSATVGFHALSDLARSMEHALQHGRLLGPETALHAEAFTDAAQEIRRLLSAFADGRLETARPAVAEALQAVLDSGLPDDALSLYGDTAFSDSLGADGAQAPIALVAAPPAPPLQDPVAESRPDGARRPGVPQDDAGAGAPASEQSASEQPASARPEAASPDAGAAPAARMPAVPAPPAAPAAATATAMSEAQDAAAFANDQDDIDAVDDIDADLFPIFEDEALELMPALGGSLRRWAARPDDGGARAEVLRALHTLKGSARLAGAMRLGEQAHRFESAIESLGAEAAIDDRTADALLARFDAMSAHFDRLRARAGDGDAAEDASSSWADEGVAVPASAGASADEQDAAGAPQDGDARAAAPRDAAADAAPAPVAVPMPAAPADAAAAEAPRGVALGTSVRVRARLLDRLVGQVGEVMGSRSRLESHVGQMRLALDELNGNLERLRRQLRDVELQAETQMQSRLALTRDAASGFDPLEFDRFTRVQELTRMMAESVDDVATVQRNMQRLVEGAEDEIVAQGRQARDLQHDLLRTRMVEFEGISERLYAVARQTAKETGKQIKLDIVGGRIEMDRGVLERMTPAFEHLLRNAVVHGIEPPEARAAVGKPATGTITIGLHHEGNDVAVEFRDDGAGLDLDRIRDRARALGLVGAEARLDDRAATDLIFSPGFSTAEQVTGLAGRGIGMDVVRAEVQSVGGRIQTDSVPGQGVGFRMVLPLTTAVTRVVMLRAGALVIGVPAGVVEQVRRVGTEEIDAAYRDGAVEHDGEAVPFFWAGALLRASTGSREAPARSHTLVVLRSASQRLAVHVDEVLGNQEVVVKNLGPQLARLPGLAGMSVLPSGATVLIYNLVALSVVYGAQVRADLAATAAMQAAGGTAPRIGPAEPGEEPTLPLVLVVDDSITVRRVTQRLLRREGYRVALAADGLQALERLQEERPALVLSDIEMPRMDGFDLARSIRADARWKDLPIVMITSRLAPKHKEHAETLGVDHYLGKPYPEEELMALVRRYGAVAGSARA